MKKIFKDKINFLVSTYSVFLLLTGLLVCSQNVVADEAAQIRMNNSIQMEAYDNKITKSRTSTTNQQVIRLVLDTGTVGYTCGPLTCVCSGDDDCNNMFTSACSSDTSGDVCVGDTCQCNAN